MLAYVFWHWSRDGIARDRYEDLIAAFQASLDDSPPAGFLGSAVFRAPSVPAVRSAPCYEAWHYLDGSAALDVLDEFCFRSAKPPVLPAELSGDFVPLEPAGRELFPLVKGNGLARLITGRRRTSL